MQVRDAEDRVVHASPLRRHSRRIFHPFMRAKACSPRALTCLWERVFQRHLRFGAFEVVEGAVRAVLDQLTTG